MTHENLETDTEYAVLNRAKKIIYKTNTVEAAKARRDKMDPQWTIVEIVSSYREVF